MAKRGINMWTNFFLFRNYKGVVFNFFSEINMIAMTFSTIGNRKIPLPRQNPSTTTYLDQTRGQSMDQSMGQGQGQSMDQGLSQKRFVNPAIIGGMFQRIQNVTGCGSCGGAV